MNNWETFKKLYNAGTEDTADNFDYHFKEQFADVDFAGKSVLEVGCGKGFLSLYIALFTNAAKITALDESTGEGSEVGVLNILKRNVSYLRLGKRLEVIEADALKYKPEPFDVIVANNCLHHFVANGQKYWQDSRVSEGYQEMFGHFASLLKDDGVLIVGEIDPLNLWHFLLPKLVFPHTDWKIHPSLSAWIDAIEKGGFFWIVIKTVVPYKLRVFKKLLSHDIFRPVLRGGVLIYAQKGWKEA